jgi:hypothetical protein
MINKTEWYIPSELLEEAISTLPSIDYRLTLNEPTGRFFYDKWKVKEEFVGTVWDKILNSLPYEKGEARLIKLDPGTTYMSHADLDDRWHMSLTGNQSYLINLSDDIMYKLDIDGYWHSMNAGKLHVAANFGEIPRVQLVVRQLLKQPKYTSDFVQLKIIPAIERFDSRYQFDKTISPWLNQHIKTGDISDLSVENGIVSMKLFDGFLIKLNEIVKPYFKVVLSN